MILSDAVRVMIPAALAFALGIAIAPILAHYLYRYRAWKKYSGKGNAIGGGGTPVFDELHKEREVSTPRMGGILIWLATIVTALAFKALHYLAGPGLFSDLDFVTRSQTWLPLFALATGAFFGLIDDIFEISEHRRGGLRLSRRLAIVGLLGLFCGWWFYTKLGVASIAIPFAAPLYLGWLFVPFFVLVVLAIYAGGTIDGLDGLAGGVFSVVFISYAGIALWHGQVSLAAFAATVAGATLAFLWFNIPPARFYMSETGSMALTLALAVTAFSADVLGDGIGVAVLPIVAFPLAGTVAATLLQIFWKKVFKRKLFRVAPVHHHFEALGWPAYKVVMRYWVITIIAAIVGITISLAG
jgi:phospho-N-acetylmuramoyl-pentapeptide-transferase